ncbi:MULTISPECIES: DUF3221 domain-containing protein [Bacillus]|uniref:Uncharacterized protein n=1 Tax=Bacillus pseudomycoides TaxID=64104 RepID=A0A1Y3MM17_9BACI|nr:MULTISPECIES: DUF3221 domain-containing protein [Bacillus cereus group]EOP49937.1 hypothetical protein IIW_03346 [Bacillus cereus VD136]EOP65712.1 hypothetical protein KOW_02075 [Bacillus cereus VDM006]EOQ02477.1 hypothetical protein KOY_02211 [Bacillus cereus VDM021]OOG92518.1 hypothetical protein BTH41_05021 [Bacillus mycoides]MDF2084493.1 DUF3221 domain-containing protein [Bacillus pseudomycoides]
MKRNTWMLCVYVLFTVSFVILIACTRNEQTENEPASVQQQTEQGAMEGYVIVKNTTVYFASNKKFDTKKELQRYVDQQKHMNIPADTILRLGDKNAYKQLKSGYKIRVWSSQILESYPGKMTVNKFEIVEKNDI